MKKLLIAALASFCIFGSQAGAEAAPVDDLNALTVQTQEVKFNIRPGGRHVPNDRDRRGWLSRQHDKHHNPPPKPHYNPHPNPPPPPPPPPPHKGAPPPPHR